LKRLKDLQDRVFGVGAEDFEELALEIFNFQAQENSVYRSYLNHLGIKPEEIKSLEKIPFLPIEFFKTQEVKSGNWEAEVVFESSGTGYGVRSRHYVPDMGFYLEGTVKAFEPFYGSLSEYAILALLPSYLERQHSSLVAMVEHFINSGVKDLSGFFLYEQDALLAHVEKARAANKKILLIGVSFALLDLAEKGADLSSVVVMETGGMKGRRKEMVRAELHATLQAGLGVKHIHSEYGMTELLSQAYAREGGRFETPPWMQLRVRDLNDPFGLLNFGRTGGVNVIDLANVHSCSFIETQDIGICHANGTFEIMGRFDNSEVRGCNLLLFS
jgi:hypothetical protein